MKIGDRIRLKRNEKGLSQRDLAALMGYSHHSTLARIENGSVDVSQKKIVQFAEVLGVSVAYLMGWNEEKEEGISLNSSLSEEECEWLDLFRSVPEQSRPLLLETFRTFKKIPLDLQPEALDMLRLALRMQKRP